MKVQFMVLAGIVTIALAAGAFRAPAAAARDPYLSKRSAVHALRADLRRGYGIGDVHADCRRRARSRFSCSWRGRRSDGAYRGAAQIRRVGRTTAVQLSGVRRA
jgi:hypothetical protein